MHAHCFFKERVIKETSCGSSTVQRIAFQCPVDSRIRVELEHWLHQPLALKSSRSCSISPVLSVLICTMGMRIPTPHGAARVKWDNMLQITLMHVSVLSWTVSPQIHVLLRSSDCLEVGFGGPLPYVEMKAMWRQRQSLEWYSRKPGSTQDARPSKETRERQERILHFDFGVLASRTVTE